MKEIFTIDELNALADPDRHDYFNTWVLDFFRREVLRETGRLSEYEINPLFGQAMRPEVSYWNPNRSKHAEVFWLENYVFGQETSIRNKILNAMSVKFVGMPTLTLVASDSTDFSKIIDFDEYTLKGDYYHTVNRNLDTNKHKVKVWGATQLQTSLQTAARNFVRDEEGDQNIQFRLSHMIRWIDHLDKLGMSEVVQNTDSKLGDVCDWLRTHRGIGPYFSYHPPCNFSRSNQLSHIDEDDDYCLVGPGALRGMQFVFPDVKFKNNDIMEKIVLSVRTHQDDFFKFHHEEDYKFYKENLERGGKLTTFGTEITFCQFACFQAIKDLPKSQEKRILPLTFDAFYDIAKNLEKKMNPPSLECFFE